MSNRPSPSTPTGVVPPRPRHDADWRDRAACATDPQPDRWVDLPPVRVRGRNNPAYDAHLADLSQTCGTCPVRAHCLWEGLDNNVGGVFAGTDEYERADLRDQLDLPIPPRVPAPENAEDARVMDQRFTALRMARWGYTNKQIARTLCVSAMTVSRLTADEDKDSARRTRNADTNSADSPNGEVINGEATAPVDVPGPSAAPASTPRPGRDYVITTTADFDVLLTSAT